MLHQIVLGGKIEDLEYYIIPSLKEQKSDIAVIHKGGNIINFKNLKSINTTKLLPLQRYVEIVTYLKQFFQEYC